jgi:adenylate kinase
MCKEKLMMEMVLIGPQGSGKGTQANLILEEFQVAYIEAGRMLRERAMMHDKKGEIIDHLINKKGELLPDGVVLDMIADELEEGPKNKGHLFDGFPRTIRQYEALKELLNDQKIELSHGIYLKISDQVSLQRLMARRHCIKCNKGYSLNFEPKRSICDCGGELAARTDDNLEAINKRLALFHQSTQPILEQMKKDGILSEINGELAVDQIFEQIKACIHK